MRVYEGGKGRRSEEPRLVTRLLKPRDLLGGVLDDRVPT